MFEVPNRSPAEGLLNFVDRKLHRRRRFRFRNAPRLQTILNLMRASEAGQAGQAELVATSQRNVPSWEVDAELGS